MLPEYKAYESWAHYVQPPSSLHTRTHVLLLPPLTLPIHPRLIAELGDVARSLRADVVFGPQGVLLVHWQRYYAAVGRHLATLRAEGFNFQVLRAMLLDAGLVVKDVPAQVRGSATIHQPGVLEYAASPPTGDDKGPVVYPGGVGGWAVGHRAMHVCAA